MSESLSEALQAQSIEHTWICCNCASCAHMPRKFEQICPFFPYADQSVEVCSMWIQDQEVQHG